MEGPSSLLNALSCSICGRGIKVTLNIRGRARDYFSDPIFHFVKFVFEPQISFLNTVELAAFLLYPLRKVDLKQVLSR